MNDKWKKFFKSFDYAWQGIKAGFKGRNMKVQSFVAIGVVIAGFLFKISTSDWLIIIVLIGVVLGAELMNSSIEEMANLMRDTHKYEYKTTKALRDMAAGAVLIVSIAAAIVGFIIFTT